MKLRIGFVSNSSSSSYVCDVCGIERSGWDLTLNEAYMYECTNGHDFCDDHLIKLEEWRKIKAYLLYHTWWAKDKPDAMEELATLEGDDVLAFADKHGYFPWDDSEDRYECPPASCPICTFQTATSGDMLEYLMHSMGWDRNQVLEEMRFTFPDYSAFKRYVGRK